jgi:hypothetical protein
VVLFDFLVFLPVGPIVKKPKCDQKCKDAKKKIEKEIKEEQEGSSYREEAEKIIQ